MELAHNSFPSTAFFLPICNRDTTVVFVFKTVCWVIFFIRCVMLSKLLNFSEPKCPYLQKKLLLQLCLGATMVSHMGVEKTLTHTLAQNRHLGLCRF